MNHYLSKRDICNTLSSTVQFWQDPPKELMPCFNIEMTYAECFLHYISQLPVPMRINFTSFVSTKIRMALDASIQTLTNILDSNPNLNSSIIYECISQDKFILRRDRRAYNLQVPGKYPKGLTRTVWEEYNNWVLTNQYWQGFLWSQEPGFQINLPPETSGPIHILLSEETKPLWGMRMKACSEVGIPYNGYDGDCVTVYPFECFARHFCY